MACQNWHVSFSGMPEVAFVPEPDTKQFENSVWAEDGHARNDTAPFLACQKWFLASTFWLPMSTSDMPDVTSGMPKVDIYLVPTLFINSVETWLVPDSARQCQLLACHMSPSDMPGVNFWHAKYGPKLLENNVKTWLNTVWCPGMRAESDIWHPETVRKQCKTMVQNCFRTVWQQPNDTFWRVISGF